MTTQASNQNLDLLMGVPLDITVELGSTKMLVKDILKLSIGAVVELERAAASPVDLLVNERLVARGEIIAVDDNFGVRVTEIVNQVLS